MQLECWLIAQGHSLDAVRQIPAMHMGVLRRWHSHGVIGFHRDFSFVNVMHNLHAQIASNKNRLPTLTEQFPAMKDFVKDNQVKQNIPPAHMAGLIEHLRKANAEKQDADTSDGSEDSEQQRTGCVGQDG